MDEFQTIAKLWPAGADIDLGTDSNLLGGPATFTRNAADFVTSPDGTQNYRFLFWNTGRHITNKRRVRWNFSVLGWGTWTATRWYGTPPTGNGGKSRVRADAFSLGSNATMIGTPIDASSTFAAGAWPSGGDNHVIDTSGGAANVVARDPFPGPASSTYDFAGWLALQFGGDPSGEYVESDSGTSGSFGGTGFYEHVLGTSYPVAMGQSADLIATYGTRHTGGGFDPGRIRDWIYQILTGDPSRNIPTRGDPSPEDFIRLKILTELLASVQPQTAGPIETRAPAGVDFQQLIAAAPNMSKEDLKRALQSINTSLDLGKTALSALEAQLKRAPK